jgi:hypothetical protein
MHQKSATRMLWMLCLCLCWKETEALRIGRMQDVFGNDLEELFCDRGPIILYPGNQKLPDVLKE